MGYQRNSRPGQNKIKLCELLPEKPELCVAGMGLSSIYFTGSLLLSHKGDETAEGGLATTEFPGEAANPDALVEYVVDLPASVLDVEDAVGEHVVVHQL